MIIALADIYAQVPRREQVSAAMQALQEIARRRAGCVSFSFAEQVGEPGHYLSVQVWREQAALEEHHRSPEFAAYQAAITGQLVRDSDLRVYLSEQDFRPRPGETLDLAQDD